MTKHRPLATFALALILSAQPLVAQDRGEAPRGDLAEGAEMVTEGLKRLFQGLMGELEPAGEAAEEGWNDLVDWLGDLSAYETPERLPNGDIVIRRKDPLVPGTDL